MISWFQKQWFIILATLLLFGIPEEAHAHAQVALVEIIYPFLAICHLALLMVFLHKLSQRRLAFLLIYVIFVGLMWRFIVLHLPGVDVPIDGRQPSIDQHGIADWIFLNHERRLIFLMHLFGDNLGFALFLALAVGVPIVLPPLLGGFLYRRFRGMKIGTG